MAKRICSHPGCESPRKARGFCMNHYAQAKRDGALPPPRPRSTPQYYIEADNGCWVWQKAMVGNGYGAKYSDGKMVVAHRWMYEKLVGPIPDGLQLDHLCRNRACVNPSHLEPVTPRENTYRGVGQGAVNARKTHCVNGHPFDAANTYIRPNGGGRLCRACRSERQCMYDREARAAKRRLGASA